MILDQDPEAEPVGSVFAAAKINLALHVVGKRPDGYHDLDSLVVFADIGDTIDAFAAPSGSGIALEIGGPFAGGLTSGPDNLILRAAGTLLGLPPLTLRLTKRLPIASGIGGGSADAAAALRLLAPLAHPVPSAAALSAIAARLGADVPMCLWSRTLRAEGVGDILTEWPDLPRLSMVLANPGVSVATPDIFRRLRHRDGAPLPAILPRFRDAIALADWLASATRNDLQAAAIEAAPIIAATLEAMRATTDCLFARMSGSGATVFGLYPDSVSASRAAADLSAAHPGWWVAETSSFDGS